MRIGVSINDLVEVHCTAFKEQFMKYSDLWMHDMAESLTAWLEANSTPVGALRHDDCHPLFVHDHERLF
jgi:hypothetical protein